MSGLTRDSKNRNKGSQFQNPKQHEEKVLDLTKTHYELDHDFECEKCGLKLILFPQAQQLFPFSKGPSYICPQCHEITDSAFGNMLHADDIKPIDIQPPTLTFVPEEKADESYTRFQDIDPEPQEEERLRNMGATIKDKRVIARRDY